MKNKKTKIISIILLTAMISIYVFNYIKDSNIYEENVVNKITKGISLNLEQTEGAGDYKLVTQSSWPTDGYKFNSELSRCENGGELSWDDTNKIVVMSGNVSDKCYVYFDIYVVPSKTLAEYVLSQYTGTQGENNLYYHNSSLTNGAGDNSYRYAGGDYILTDAGKATGASMIIGYNNTLTTALIDFYCNGARQYVGYAHYCNRHDYLIKGDTTQYQTYNEALAAAVTKGYLTKDNVNNFVCFGTDETPCPTDNLYRIIGVFNNQVKLIKWDYAKSSLLGTDGGYSTQYTYYFSGEQGESPASNSFYKWVNSLNSPWNASDLNKTNLNTNFLNNIGNKWANKIVTTTWKVGGGTIANLQSSVPTIVYQYEVGSSASTTTYNAKIGLMYISDYEYAANPSAWKLVGKNESDITKSYGYAKGENWLYGGCWEWTISRNSADSKAFGIFNDGSIASAVDNYTYGVRPSFLLDSSITYVSGVGTMNEPIRIN